MDYDGTLVIGTDLDESGLDKRIRKLESKLKNEEIDLEIKASNVDNVKKEMQGISAEMKALIKQRNELNKSISSKKSQYDRINSSISSGKAISPEEYNRYGSLENQLTKMYSQQEAINKEVEKYNQLYNKLDDKLAKAEASYDKQKNKVTETKTQIAEMNDEIRKTNLENIKQQSNGIGNSIENIVKKVTRWGLAIFGVRSAYMFIRQAMSTLSQYNEKIGADVQYIRFALATMLQPIIETIIKLVYKLLAYINYIAKAWFGVNLFANASTKAFEKTNKSVKDTNKSAQKLKKTLAGFDEMNILQEDGSVGSGGGGGGVTLPSSDLSNFDNIEIPEWIQWIADNKDSILGTLRDIGIMIGVAFATVKILEFYGVITKISTALGGLSTLATFGVIAGFAATLVGIIKTVTSIITFINDPSWTNFTGVLDGLAIALTGVGVAMVALNASNPVGWIAIALGLVMEVVKWIGNLIGKQEEEVKSTISVRDANKELTKAQESLNKATNSYSTALKNNKKTKDELAEAEKKAKQTGKELYNQVLLGIVSFDDMTDTQKDLYGKYLDNMEAEEELRQKTLELQQANDKSAAAEQRKAAAVYASTGKYTEYFNTLVKGYEDGKISSQKMQNAVQNIMLNLDDETRKTFAENLPTSIKNGFQKTLDELGRTDLRIKDVSSGITISYKEIASSTKSTFETNVPNSVQKSINKVDSLTKSIDNLKKKGNVNISVKTTTSSSSTSSKNAKGGIAYFAKGGIMRLPKLAPGGVINQPGRGVAIGGERGAEAVVPLTDTQQMELLGKAIGRYIKVALTNRVYVGNREVAREMKNIEAEENFAFNN